MQSDLITDVILELNHAEVAAATMTNETYSHMIQVFSSTFDLGKAFVMREDMLDKLEETQTTSIQMVDAVKKMHEDISALQLKTEVSMKEINEQLRDALAVNREETYRKLSDAIREANLPVPFKSIEEAEEFLGAGQVHRDAIALAFSNCDAAMAAKDTVDKQVQKRFPAGLMLDFLLCKEAKASLRVSTIGPSVRAFISDRARWLMGDTWIKKPEESIMFKISQHIHYADSRLLKRSKRLRDRKLKVGGKKQTGNKA